MVLSEVLHCRLVYRHTREVFKMNLKSSIPDGSIDTNFSSELSNHCFKKRKQFRGAFRLQKLAETPQIVFPTLNNNCLAHNRPTELTF
jgi:hypothetical protein